MKGIDIYEGDNIQDWNTIKQQGIEAVIQKATQGTTHVDKLLQYRYSKIKEAGLKIGFYHFAQFNSSDPTSEAQHFLSAISGLESDTVLWIDIEAAEYLADFLNCPTIDLTATANAVDFSKVENAYFVGGGLFPALDNLKVIKGNDRFDTVIEVLKNIGKLK